MEISQAVPNPRGLAVLGTTQLLVPPDYADVRCAVVRVHDEPPQAFAAATEAAQAVREFLDRAGVHDVRTSRLLLSEHLVYSAPAQRRVPQGYEAQIDIHIALRQLDKLETVLAGLVEGGVNKLHSTTFGTSKLAAFRRQARTSAVAAARAKAELYASAAGRALGSVLHIEDVNPETLRGREGMHIRGAALPEDKEPGAVDPGAITVGAAVHVTYGWEEAAP